MAECQRCGDCCQVGLLFWRAIADDFGESTFLYDFANGFPKHEHIAMRTLDGMPCMMLRIVEGEAVCLIEKHFGRDTKPRVCREHRCDGGLKCN